MVLYHGTSKRNAERIMKEGFSKKARPTWRVKGKRGFVYLSLAYAPFYSFAQHNNMGAIIKVEVDDDKLYPEDDFLMYAFYNKPVYTQKDINRVNLEYYQEYAPLSLQFMGNACAHVEDVRIIGVRTFDSRRLVLACDPAISPMNYKIMGEYYRRLTEHIYDTGEWENFSRDYWEKYIIEAKENSKGRW